VLVFAFVYTDCTDILTVVNGKSDEIKWGC